MLLHGNNTAKLLPLKAVKIALLGVGLVVDAAVSYHVGEISKISSSPPAVNCDKQSVGGTKVG